MTENPITRLFYKIATGKDVYRKLLTPVGPLFFFGLVALMIYLAVTTDEALHLPAMLGSPYNVLLSVPFIALGIFLIVWSASYFFMAKGTPVPFNPPKSLVVKGPYARSRNPMITGVFIALFGTGMWLGSCSLLFFYLPLFIILAYLEIKKVEEPELEKRLGDSYREYRSKTPLFFPRKKGND